MTRCQACSPWEGYHKDTAELYLQRYPDLLVTRTCVFLPQGTHVIHQRAKLAFGTLSDSREHQYHICALLPRNCGTVDASFQSVICRGLNQKHPTNNSHDGPYHPDSNLVPRVLWLFGQRMGASRDSGIMEKYNFLDWSSA